MLRIELKDPRITIERIRLSAKYNGEISEDLIQLSVSPNVHIQLSPKQYAKFVTDLCEFGDFSNARKMLTSGENNVILKRWRQIAVTAFVVQAVVGLLVILKHLL